MPGVIILFSLIPHKKPNLYSFYKTSPLVIPAQFTVWVDNLIHLPQRHTVHLLVELIEILADLFIVVGVVFVEAFVQQTQDGIRISIIRWMVSYALFQNLKKFLHRATPFPVPVSVLRHIADRPERLFAHMRCTGGNTD